MNQAEVKSQPTGTDEAAVLRLGYGKPELLASLFQRHPTGRARLAMQGPSMHGLRPRKE